MSERILSWPDFAEHIAFIAKDLGAKEALKRLHQFQVQGEYPEYIQGFNQALTQAAENEDRRMLILSRIMAFSGFFLPIESLFELGLPKKEFLVYADLTFGRLGDSLYKLCLLLHAMNRLDLVLCVRSKFSSNKRILIHNKDVFDSDVPSIEFIPPIKEYLWKTAEMYEFSRSTLQNTTRSIFLDIPTVDKYKDLNLDESLVVHVRGGDALFEGALFLPPFSYYTNCIKKVSTNKVIVLYEPDDQFKYNALNPIPNKILEYCKVLNKECILISNKDANYDAGILLSARNVVASNSYFSKMIALYSRICQCMYFPSQLNNEKQWISDDSIYYIYCWQDFDHLMWTKSLEYRMNWVLNC